MTRKYYQAGMLMTAAVLVATVIAYPHLPDSIATHWNIHNQVDGYGPKWSLYAAGPGLMALVMLLMYCLPWFSPKNFEVDSFRRTYLQIMLVLLCMAAYFFGVFLWAAFGHAVNMGRALVGGGCLAIVLCGNLMGKIRRNFFMGVRTPWALANERVWNATHRLAAKTMVVSGLVGLAISAASPNFWLVLVVLTIGLLIPAAYSFVFYKRLERLGEL
jgi:immunity protein, SdpI family